MRRSRLPGVWVREVIYKYECSLLGATVDFLVDAESRPAPGPPGKIAIVPIWDCNSKFVCGLTEQDAQGRWRTDWTRCPAYSTLKTKGSL
jgi:hypothetical protein